MTAPIKLVMPNRLRPIRVVATWVLPWLLLGAVRAALRIGFAEPPNPWTVLGRSIAIAAFWVMMAPVLYQFGRTWRPSIGGLLAPQVVAAILLEPAWAAAVVQPTLMKTWPTFIGWIIDRLDLNLFTTLAIVGLGVWRRHADDKIRLDASDRARRSALRRAELELLNNQIQPHFLFNALNTVVELVHRDVTLARQFLADLNRLLTRSAAPEGRAESTLGEEIDWLRSYLAVQRQRFGARLTIVIEVSDSLRSIPVPALVLQPLVENAIRHGVEAVEGEGTIVVAASASGGRLTIVIRNPAPESRPGAAGIGLSNVRRRLEMTYGDDYLLRLDQVDREATTRLSFPVRHATPNDPEVEWVTGSVLPRSRLSVRAGIGLAAGVWVVILAVWYLAVGASASLTGADASGGPIMVVEAATYLGLTIGAASAVGILRRRMDEGAGWVLSGVVVVAAAVLVAEALSLVVSEPIGLGWRKANWAEQRLAILGAIVVAAHGWWQHQSRAAAAAAANALEEEVGRTRFAQIRWRIQPTLVRRALDRAGVLAATDPARAEEVLLALSRLLRGTLDRPHEAWADLSDELRQVADFRQLVAMIEPTMIRGGFVAEPDDAASVPRGALSELVGRLTDNPELALETLTVSWRDADRAFVFEPAGNHPERAAAIEAVATAARATGFGAVTAMPNQVSWSLAEVPIGSPDRGGVMTLEAA